MILARSFGYRFYSRRQRRNSSKVRYILETSSHGVQPLRRSRERSTNRCTLNDTIPPCDKNGFSFGKARRTGGGTRAEWLREAFRQRAIRLPPCPRETEIGPELPVDDASVANVIAGTRSCHSSEHRHARRDHFLYLRKNARLPSAHYRSIR